MYTIFSLQHNQIQYSPAIIYFFLCRLTPLSPWKRTAIQEQKRKKKKRNGIELKQKQYRLMCYFSPPRNSHSWHSTHPKSNHMTKSYFSLFNSQQRWAKKKMDTVTVAMMTSARRINDGIVWVVVTVTYPYHTHEIAPCFIKKKKILYRSKKQNWIAWPDICVNSISAIDGHRMRYNTHFDYWILK